MNMGPTAAIDRIQCNRYPTQNARNGISSLQQPFEKASPHADGLGVDKCQKIGAELLFVRVGDAMRRIRIDLQCRILDEIR